LPRPLPPGAALAHASSPPPLTRACGPVAAAVHLDGEEGLHSQLRVTAAAALVPLLGACHRLGVWDVMFAAGGWVL
jgi:hypothetical protein